MSSGKRGLAMRPCGGLVVEGAGPAEPHPSGLHGQIPYVSGVRSVHPQSMLLLWRGYETVARHKSNVLATTDISEGVKRRLLAGPNARISAPRIR